MSESRTQTVEREEGTGDRRSGRRLTVALLLVLIAAVAVGGYWFVTQGPGVALLSPQGSTVVELSGTGDQSTDTFQVRGGWEIHWETTGERFALAIVGDQDLGTVVGREEPGSGVTFRAEAGTYRVEVSAAGPWSLRIVQGP